MIKKLIYDFRLQRFKWKASQNVKMSNWLWFCRKKRKKGEKWRYYTSILPFKKTQIN